MAIALPKEHVEYQFEQATVLFDPGVTLPGRPNPYPRLQVIAFDQYGYQRELTVGIVSGQPTQSNRRGSCWPGGNSGSGCSSPTRVTG